MWTYARWACKKLFNRKTLKHKSVQSCIKDPVVQVQQRVQNLGRPQKVGCAQRLLEGPVWKCGMQGVSPDYVL